jgi:5-methylcytosine-specific restriction endonuclease McrA
VKRCSVCKEWLEDAAFGPDKRATTGLRCDCRACRSKVDPERGQQHISQPLPQSKTCSDCGQNFPPESFSRDRKLADGLHSRCKSCRGSKRRAQWGDAEREYERRYYAAHLEQSRAASRRSYWRHRDYQIAMSKLRYLTHKAEHKVKGRAWYERNREKVKQAVRRWVSTHRAERRLISVRGSQLRRARIQGVTADFTHAQWLALVATYKGCCAYCGKQPERLTMDHVIPLAKGGAHTASNIVPACGHCNYTKHVSAPPTFQPVLLL